MASEFRGIEVFGRASRRRAEAATPARRWKLGVGAALAALLTAAGTITGILSSMAGRYESGILLAYLSTGTSVVAVICGLAALMTGRGRGWGVFGLIVGILASPPILTRLLAWASGLG